MKAIHICSERQLKFTAVVNDMHASTDFCTTNQAILLLWKLYCARKDSETAERDATRPISETLASVMRAAVELVSHNHINFRNGHMRKCEQRRNSSSIITLTSATVI